MIHYTTTPTAIAPHQLAGGFFVGWPSPPSPETHLRLLRGSDHVVLALDDATGMALATGMLVRNYDRQSGA